MTAPTDQVAPPAAIDPRIRQRRIEVRRDEGRRRLRLLVSVAAVIAVLVGAWGLTRSPLLDVDRVRVLGAHNTTASAVRDATRIRPGDPMTGVSEGTAARRLARLPWVVRGTVHRRWPGTVVVRVTERSPAAVVRAMGGGWMLVDRGGRLLTRVPLPPEALEAVEVPGPPPAMRAGAGVDRRARGALAVAAAIPAERVRQVRVVAQLDDGTLELRLVPRGVVRFGPPTDVPAKLLAVFTILDRVSLRRVAVIDVRVPAAPVLTRA